MPFVPDKRLEAATRLAIYIHRTLQLDFGIELWDGRTIPAGLGPDDLRIVVTDGAALTRLVRRPKATTLIDLHAAGLIDLRGGSLFDIAARRPKVRTRAILKSLDKWFLLRNALPILFGSTTLPPAETPATELVGDERERSSGSSKQDIEFHYDVSNDFYKLFLDPRMVYTCAYFKDWSNDLETAQRDKLDMICRKLRLKPGDRFLDIGSGWGALVCHAAEHYGVNAVGVTLSTEQATLARALIAEKGLGDRVRIELQDYRTMDGPFDKISSIGMFEAVGFDNYDAYFSTVHRLLAEGGLYLHHAITRPAKRDIKKFHAKNAEYKALIKYIFPGGELDWIGLTATNLETHGFEIHDVEGWREHYAQTTELWARRLMARFDEAAAIAGAARTRIWILYLAGVSLAFRNSTVGLYQTLASKRRRGPAALPPTRADLYA